MATRLPSIAYVRNLLHTQLDEPTQRDLHTWNAVKALVRVWRFADPIDMPLWSMPLMIWIGIAVSVVAHKSALGSEFSLQDCWWSIGLLAFAVYTALTALIIWADQRDLGTRYPVELAIIRGDPLYAIGTWRLSPEPPAQENVRRFRCPGLRSPLDPPVAWDG